MKKWILASMLCVISIGCGGAGSQSNMIVGGMGAATVSFSWPDPTRVIPSGTDKLELEWYLQTYSGGWPSGRAGALQGTKRTVVRGSNATETIAFANLPEATVSQGGVVDGDKRLVLFVDAFNNSRRTASASQTVNIVAGETTSVEMTLSSAIANIEVVGSLTSLGTNTSFGAKFAGLDAGPYPVPVTGAATFKIQPLAAGTGRAIVPIDWSKVRLSTSGDVSFIVGNQLSSTLTPTAGDEDPGEFQVLVTGPNPGSINISTVDQGAGGDFNFSPRSFAIAPQMPKVSGPTLTINPLNNNPGANQVFTGSNPLSDVAAGPETDARAHGLTFAKRANPPQGPKSWYTKQNSSSSLFLDQTAFAVAEPDIAKLGKGRLASDNSDWIAIESGSSKITTRNGSQTFAPVFTDVAALQNSSFYLIASNGNLYRTAATPLNVQQVAGVSGVAGANLALSRTVWGAPGGMTVGYSQAGAAVKRFSVDALFSNAAISGIVSATDIAASDNLLFALKDATVSVYSWTGSPVTSFTVPGTGKRLAAFGRTILVAYANGTTDSVARYEMKNWDQ